MIRLIALALATAVLNDVGAACAGRCHRGRPRAVA